MEIRGIVWLGTRTVRFGATRDFFARVAGAPHIDEAAFAVWDLANGDRLEVFGPGGDAPPFEDAPVAGFLVDDVGGARAALEQIDDVEFIGPIHDDGTAGNQWSYFRAPDGHVYEVTNQPDHPLRRRATSA